MLIENAISGSLIFLGITLYSPLLGLMALLSSFIGTGTGKYCGGDKLAVNQGIYGFNSILSSVAAILFLQSGWRWVIALVVAAIAAVLMKILLNTMAKWKVPVLTVPFVLATWVGLLVAYRIESLSLNPAFNAASLANWNIPFERDPHFFIGLIKGVGEVFMIDSFWAGSLILIALFRAGWRFGVYAMTGALVSWVTAFSIGVDVEVLDLGLYNYNAVLTMIAVGLMFDDKRNFPLIGIFASAMTVPITAGMDMALDLPGLPVLTSPFIVSTWLFLAIRKAVPKIEPQFIRKK